MAYDPGALEATLAAAIGDDPALAAELRAAFLTSAAQHVESLGSAHHAEAWQRAALRLKGLAASFGAVELMAAAETAGSSPPGDAATLRRVRRLLASFAR